MESEITLSNENNFKVESGPAVLRITALWALSESLLGGFLHAAQMPFRGLIIASTAVLFISLIFYFSKNTGQILKSFLLVSLVKFALSPHTPVMSYFALSYQAIIGYLFFRFISSYRLSAVLVGSSVLMMGGIQKVLTLTLIFGTDIWKTVDTVASDLLLSTGLNLVEAETVNISFIMISIYIFIHLSAGIIIGLIAGKLPMWILNSDFNNLRENFSLSNEHKIKSSDLTSRGSINKYKISFVTFFFILVSVALLILSILFDQDLVKNFPNILIIILRGMFFLTFWFLAIKPLAGKLITKLLNKNSRKHAEEVSNIISFLPQLRIIVNYCWQTSHNQNQKGVKLKKFLISTIQLTIFADSTQFKTH
jgi:hypothetical protein